MRFGRALSNFGLARPLFVAAWVCPTIALLCGDLQLSRILAATMLAAGTGIVLASLPPRAFQAARIVTAALFPLCWLWMGYAALNGTGPSAPDALATIINTNYPEASTALRLMSERMTIMLGLLQLGLLGASFIGGSASRVPRAMQLFALSLLLLLTLDCMAEPIGSPWPPLPAGADWDDFPYGSMGRVVAAAIADPGMLHREAAFVMRHRAAAERHVDRHIDAIFIIGESFRFDGRWAAGDNANWKPLARRFDAQLGVLLPKVCASADATAVSVPMLMTGVPPDHHLDVAVTPSGLDRLSAAGYLTAWISNQGERDDSRDFVWSRNGFAGALDDDLIPVMAAFLGGSDPRNKAAVVHLFDSHIVYASRYPPMPEPAGLDREQLELLRYQRANDHTLLVLQEIAAVLDLQRTPAFAVYVSDHGDNLLIDHNGFHYHIGARTSAKAAYVPSMVFWNSAFLKAEDPVRRLQQLRAAGSLAHSDIYHVWMSFAGLDDPLSPTPDPRILGTVQLADPRRAVSCSRLSP